MTTVILDLFNIYDAYTQESAKIDPRCSLAAPPHRPQFPRQTTAPCTLHLSHSPPRNTHLCSMCLIALLKLTFVVSCWYSISEIAICNWRDCVSDKALPLQSLLPHSHCAPRKRCKFAPPAAVLLLRRFAVGAKGEPPSSRAMRSRLLGPSRRWPSLSEKIDQNA